jgi:hypothetical protein
MLNPCFKSLRVVKSFVGCENAICIVIEYNVKEVIPFLMKFSIEKILLLKHFVAPCDGFIVQVEGEGDNMFDVGTMHGRVFMNICYCRTHFISEVIYPTIYVCKSFCLKANP